MHTILATYQTHPPTLELEAKRMHAVDQGRIFSFGEERHAVAPPFHTSQELPQETPGYMESAQQTGMLLTWYIYSFSVPNSTVI